MPRCNRFAVPVMMTLATLLWLSIGAHMTHADELAVINIDGDVVFGPSSPLTLQVQAPSPLFSTPVPGDDHDKLNITGSATLGGTLVIELLSPGTRPNLGTEYQVMTFGTRTIGMFPTMFTAIDNVILDTDYALAPLFTDTDLTVRATMPGDLNFDNKVSIADLSSFALNFSTFPGRGSWELGDFNADGAVTVSDLSLLALNFGFGTEMGNINTATIGLPLETVARMAGIEVSAIPEPATAGLVGAPLLMFLHRRPRTAI